MSFLKFLSFDGLLKFSDARVVKFPLLVRGGF